jgi:hypothetical protein
MRAIIRYALIAALLAVALYAPTLARAQQIRPMTLSQVERLFISGVGVSQILQTAREACIDFRIDGEAEQRLIRAGATTAFLTSLRDVCHRAPGTVMGPLEPQQQQPRPTATRPRRPAPSLIYDPGTAMTRSFLVPGLGQFYTGRPGLGFFFMGAWGGALGAGLLVKEKTIECFEPQDPCPPSQVRAEVTTRPLLLVGVGAAVAIALLSGVEAGSAANRANRNATSNPGGSGNRSEPSPSLAAIIGARPEGGVSLGLRVSVH